MFCTDGQDVLLLSTRCSLDHFQIMQQNCGVSLKQKQKLKLTKHGDSRKPLDKTACYIDNIYFPGVILIVSQHYTDHLRIDPPSPLKFLLLLLHSPSLTRYLSVCSCLLVPGKWGKKTKHKMKIKGFKWPKRTHPLVSIQINSGSFHRLFVELFVLSRSGLIESISVLSSFLKRRNIYRNKYIIPCICYSPGPLL